MIWENILKMGMDLEAPTGDFRWNIFGWRDILNTMKAFGWKPKGALATEYINLDSEGDIVDEDYSKKPEEPERRIGYGSNDNQRVTWEDAKGMLEASKKLINTIESMKSFEVSRDKGSVGATKVVEWEDMPNIAADMTGAWKDMLREGAKIPSIEEWSNDLSYLKQWEKYLEAIVSSRGYFHIG